MLLTAWCNQLRWHQCSSGLPAIIPWTTRYWNRPVGGDDGRDCVSRSNRKWQLKSCRLIAIGPQKRLAALMVKTFNYPLGEVRLAGLSFETFAPPEVGAKFDLTLYA